jgi:hypothetical protein
LALSYLIPVIDVQESHINGEIVVSDFLKLVLAGLLSGSVISSILSVILFRRTTKMAEDIKSEYARGMSIFQSSRAWKEKSVAELLGPLYMQFDRTKRAFHRWESQNLYLAQKVIKDGNQIIRDLLLAKGFLIPPSLRDDAGRLIEHYDCWLEEFEQLRSSQQPDLDSQFVFVGPKGFPFPSDAEVNFRNAFKDMWAELYGEVREG